MVAVLPFVEKHVPVVALFRLLGVDTQKEILDVIVGEQGGRWTTWMLVWWWCQSSRTVVEEKKTLYFFIF